jgi:hypothetical protein
MTVSYGRASGTANSGDDYVAKTGTLTFATWRDGEDHRHGSQ